MKKLFVILFLAFVNITYGQKITGYFLGVNFKNKHEIMEKLRPNEYILTKPDQDIKWYWSPYVGINIDERWNLSLEYSHETIFSGYILRYPRSSYGGERVSVDIPYMFNLQTSYNIFNKNRRINIVPGIGLTYVYSIYGRRRTFDNTFNWAQKNKDGTWTVTSNTIEWKRTYGFLKNYFLLNANLRLKYRVYKLLDITLNVGYTHGFKTIGFFEGWYKVADEPKVDVFSASKGSNYYFSVGTQMNISPFKIDFSKVVNNKHKLHVYGGVSSLFEYLYMKNWLSKLNIYYGPSLSFEYSKLSTEISALFTSRIFNYYIDKYAILEEDYVNNSKTLITANVSDKVFRFQQTIYYKLFKSDKRGLKAGVGYFIQKPYYVNGETILKSATGNINKKDILKGKKVFGFFAGLNYSINITDKLFLNSGINYQLYKGRNNYFYYPIDSLIRSIYDSNFPEKWWKNRYLSLNINANYRFY